MNAKYKILTAVASVALFASCEEMDLTPEGSTVTESTKGEVYANDPDKAFAAVSGGFMKMSAYEPNYSDIGGRHADFGYPSVMLITDATGEDLVGTNTGYNWFSFQIDYTDRSASAWVTRIMWNDLYSYIYSANSIVAGIDATTEMADLQLNRAQGLALRAFSYFQLAQIYQFTYVGNESKPCVPLITNENSDDAAQNGAPRATVQEIYDQIYADLDEAVSLLTSAQANGVKRADKRYIDLATAYGLRARVNLVCQKWAAAAADATSAIEAAAASGITPASVSDVAKPTFSSVDETDWMWGVIVAETDDVVTSGIVNWISHMGTLNYGYGNYTGSFQISKKLFDTISDTDVRKGWWLDAKGNSANLTDAMQEAFAAYSGETVSKYYAPYTQVKFGPYKGVVGTETNANDIPLMRVEEMYLIKAEGEAMSGADGLTTLNNFVKTYRDPSYSYSGSDIQQEIWRQRRIELWGEGMSWFDIQRLKTGVNRLNTGFQSTYVYVIDATDANMLYPIPESEINSNPALSSADQNASGGSPASHATEDNGTATIADEKINI